MNDHQAFLDTCRDEIDAMGRDASLERLAVDWMTAVNGFNYSYHFEWQGRPIIQYPQDIVAMQELIWRVRPDLIVETGIARGGSLMLSASMLTLLDVYDAIERKETIDPARSRRRVVGVDIDIRSHNRSAIESHPLSTRIEMIEGSSIEPAVVDRVHRIASEHDRVLVCLDSDHTHDHVLAELCAYAPLATVGSYCVVFDTVVDTFPAGTFPDRSWGPGNNPRTAVLEFLESNPDFEVDERIEHKLQITVAPHGYLRRVR